MTMAANEDFFTWSGLTPQRWAELQEKLRGWARNERTPARVMKVMMTDTNVGCREQVIIAYYLGYSQGETKPRAGSRRVLNAGLN